MKKILGAILIGCSIWAETGTITIMGEEIVVTASRAERAIKEVSSNVTVITKEDIAASNVYMVSDILRSEVGAMVSDWLGNGKRVSVDLRGFGETAGMNLLVLIDGRRVNEIDMSGVDWTQIPLNQVSRIEIIRGPKSVLYGDNAVSGVINIITKDASYQPFLKAEVFGGSYKRKMGRFSISGATERFKSIVWMDRRDTDGYRKNNGFGGSDIGGKFSYKINTFLSVNISANYHEDTYGMPGGLSKIDMEQDRQKTNYPKDEAKTDDWYVKGGIDCSLGNLGNFNMDISWRERDLDSQFTSGNWRTKRHLETLGITPKYTLTKKMGRCKNRTVAGVDFYKSSALSEDFGINPPTPNRKTTIEKKSKDFYLHNEFSLLDKVIIDAGWRQIKGVNYDFISDDLVWGTPRIKGNITDDSILLEAGLVYYKKDLSLFLRGAESIRYPATDEVFSVWANPPINQNLHPQKGKHIDAGLKYTTPKFSANISLFNMDIENEIYYNPATFANENYNKTLHRGVEVGIKREMPRNLTIFGNYSYTEALFKAGVYDGNDIPGIPKHKANLGMRLAPIDGLKAAVTGNYIGQRYMISDQKNQVEKMPDFVRIDTNFSYQRSIWKITLGVNNLFNKKYCEYGATNAAGTSKLYYPSPERNWFAAVEINF